MKRQKKLIERKYTMHKIKHVTWVGLLIVCLVSPGCDKDEYPATFQGTTPTGNDRGYNLYCVAWDPYVKMAVDMEDGYVLCGESFAGLEWTINTLYTDMRVVTGGVAPIYRLLNVSNQGYVPCLFRVAASWPQNVSSTTGAHLFMSSGWLTYIYFLEAIEEPVREYVRGILLEEAGLTDEEQALYELAVSADPDAWENIVKALVKQFPEAFGYVALGTIKKALKIAQMYQAYPLKVLDCAGFLDEGNYRTLHDFVKDEQPLSVDNIGFTMEQMRTEDDYIFDRFESWEPPFKQGDLDNGPMYIRVYGVPME